jgi:hypothetical protein
MKGTPMRNHPSALSLARVALPLAGLLLAALAGCGGPSTPAPSTGPQAAPSVHQPIATSAADWKPVTDILGRTGSFGDHNTVYRIPLTRSDLHIVSDGVAIKPGLSLGGYAAMAKYDDGTMMMGDLVVTEAELPKVTDALQAHGIYQTALHKHLLEQSPPVWWTHVHAMGDPTKIAQGLRAALDATAIPAPTPRPANQPPLALDTTGINQALGRTGTADGGIYKFTIARADTVTDEGHLVPPTFGLTTTVNFQPTSDGKAAINGDLVMTGPEVQKVIHALRSGHITLVALHNHSLTDQPRLFYAHYWAVDDAVTVAKALRPAIDATNPRPAS